MRWIGVIVLLALSLAACGRGAASDVLNRFRAAGLEVENPRPASPPGIPLPSRFQENIIFDATGGNSGRGGEVFSCETKQDCDTIFAYLDRLKAQRGPYLYRSPDGTVVVYMNMGLAPDVAAKYGAVVKALS